MKRALACILAVCCLLSGGLALATEVDTTATDETITIPEIARVEDTIGLQAGTKIVVGSPTQLSGYFTTDMWSNNSADMDVRSLLHAYSTVATTQTLGLALDETVVTSMIETIDGDGSVSRTYTFVIADNLVYSDGTPITAKDYLFSLLLMGAPEISEIGGTPGRYGHILGFSEYASGESDVLAGAHLINDYSFSLQVSAQYLPFFYGLAMLDVCPYPLSVIAPGCDLLDDGEGAYLAAAENADELDAEELGFTPGEFSAEMLEKTMLDPETGYVFNPQTTSGPYMLESYDAVAHVAYFVANANYLGNYEGQKPHIERIEYRQLSYDMVLEELVLGELDLANKVSDRGVIEQGMLLSTQDELQLMNYPRSGFAFLSFACERGVTASQAVRNAVARCVDQNALIEETMGATLALAVNGYYGVGQWMVAYVSAEIDAATGQAVLDASVALEELAVVKDLDAAKALLIEDGWTLNEEGEDFVEGEDTIRYRLNGEELERLTIQWARTEINGFADALEVMLQASFDELGMELVVTKMPFDELLKYYYRVYDRTYDMFFLASNYTYVFDPYYDFNTSEAYQGLGNASGLQDEKLMELALDMRRTVSSDVEGYVRKWLTFQERFHELMPMVPLYSNVYFDLYATDIRDYNIALHSSWASAILYAWIGEAPVAEDVVGGTGEATTEDTGDGTITIIE